MMDRQIARPIPIPFSLVVKKASKARILYSDSVIPYLNDGGIAALPCRPDKEFLWAVCNWIHCLDPIEDQIENHLLQLYAIANHGRQILVQVGFHNNASSRRVAT